VKHERGVALVSVLLIVVLASALAYHLISRQDIAIASTRAVLEYSQAKEYALAAEEVARSVLHQNKASSTYDHLDEDWRFTIVPFEIPNGQVYLRIEDLNTKVNLNALSGQNYGEISQFFVKICDEVAVDSRLVPIWKDWIDADQVTTPGGMEDYEWLGFEPPMRTLDSLGAHLSELNMLVSLSSDQQHQMTEYVVILPTNEMKLNVNTTPAIVMQIFDPLLRTVDQMERSFESVEEAISTLPSLADISEYLSVSSSFFEVQVVVHYNDTRVDLTSRVLIDNDLSGGRLNVQTYSRDYSRRHFVEELAGS